MSGGFSFIEALDDKDEAYVLIMSGIVGETGLTARPLPASSLLGSPPN
jgi:hypothetical protein